MCDITKYNAALDACDIATQRLKCLNRKLAEDPTKTKLTKTDRDKMRRFYNEHLEECEGRPANQIIN